MKNCQMYVYQKYRLMTIEDEQQKQRGKQYCDGSMQRYLKDYWYVEDINIIKLINSNMGLLDEETHII
jgi:hypothetical protein